MRTKKPTLIERATQLFKAAVHQAAREEAAAAVLDYSPELDPLLFDDLIAETSKLNLTTMAHVLEAQYKSLPSLINLANRDCFHAAARGVHDLIGRFDWDGVNLAELYFESLEGAGNPSRFTSARKTTSRRPPRGPAKPAITISSPR